jgi:hypothetical protein
MLPTPRVSELLKEVQSDEADHNNNTMRKALRQGYVNWNVCRKMNNHLLMGFERDAKRPRDPDLISLSLTFKNCHNFLSEILKLNFVSL